MTYLPFISDQDFELVVVDLLRVACNAKIDGQKKIHSNVIDPFSALFQMAGFEISYSEFIEAELTRQSEKTLQNHIGIFHQRILTSVDGWHDPQSIIDAESKSKKIIAEIKNKYNTVSGGKLSDLYTTLSNLITPKTSNYKDFTAYLVQIIPAKSKRYDKPFTPANKETGDKCPSNKRIRVIDGYTFYTLVTGCPNALEDLFDVLPEVIKSVTEKDLQNSLNLDKFNDCDSLKDLFLKAYKSQN